MLMDGQAASLMLTKISTPSTHPLALVAVTRKLYEPLVVGVPDNTPVEESVKPGGKKGAFALKVYGAVPPVAVKVRLYATPTLPEGTPVPVGEIVIPSQGSTFSV
jgi:hypothetical protein